MDRIISLTGVGIITFFLMTKSYQDTQDKNKQEDILYRFQNSLYQVDISFEGINNRIDSLEMMLEKEQNNIDSIERKQKEFQEARDAREKEESSKRQKEEEEKEETRRKKEKEEDEKKEQEEKRKQEEETRRKKEEEDEKRLEQKKKEQEKKKKEEEENDREDEKRLKRLINTFGYLAMYNDLTIKKNNYNSLYSYIYNYPPLTKAEDKFVKMMDLYILEFKTTYIPSNNPQEFENFVIRKEREKITGKKEETQLAINTPFLLKYYTLLEDERNNNHIFDKDYNFMRRVKEYVDQYYKQGGKENDPIALNKFIAEHEKNYQ